MLDPAPIRARLESVRARIRRAADRAGRDPSHVRLVAVSKTFSAAHVRAAFEAGQVDFGENRVQEALPKMDETGDLPLTWHLVGHLQSNKAKKAGARFDVIHSVDDRGLVATLNEAATDRGRTVELLIQVDLAGESTKHGAPAEAVGAILTAARVCPAVRLSGLMVLPPFAADPEDARPYFARLRALRDRLAATVDGVTLLELSMGMSHDFEVAIEEGATMVRIGSAIFGERPTHQ